MTTVHLQ